MLDVINQWIYRRCASDWTTKKFGLPTSSDLEHRFVPVTDARVQAVKCIRQSQVTWLNKLQNQRWLTCTLPKLSTSSIENYCLLVFPSSSNLTICVETTAKERVVWRWRHHGSMGVPSFESRPCSKQPVLLTTGWRQDVLFRGEEEKEVFKRCPNEVFDQFIYPRCLRSLSRHREAHHGNIRWNSRHELPKTAPEHGCGKRRR